MTNKEIREIQAALEKEAELRQKISESSLEYLKLLKDIKNLHKNITEVESDYLKQQKKVSDAKLGIITLSAKELEIEEAKEKILEDNLNKLKKTKDEYTKIAKEASTLTKSLGAFTQVRKDVGAITSTVTKGYNKLKGWAGLFEIDKKIRMSALSMGLLDTQTKSFRDNLFYAGQNTIQFGVDIGELAEMQAKFSDELGRTVMLSQQGLVSMAAMAKATGLGAESAAQLASDFDRIGISAEDTSKFMEQTMNDSSKMGLNASKVVKNIQQNMKMLNRYNFKGGVNGLKKMAESMTKLGVDINMVAPMADKLFDIEGAVDMSAQLQVMGGEWAKMSDPFHLMYMARNDMEGLAKEVTNATAASAHFNSKNKQFEISAMEMHKLRKVAEQTGLNYEELAESAKKAAQFTKIRGQISFNADDDTKEFIENTAQFNDRGEAEITINGGKKLVSQLNSLDMNTLKTMMAEKKTLEDRAKESQTFDEMLGNLIKQVKSMLLPVLEGIDKALRPVIMEFSKKLSDPKFLETIKSFGESIGKLIGGIGKWIAENPIKSLLAFGIFEAAKWFANGVSFGSGFNLATSKGSLLTKLPSLLTKAGGSFGKIASSSIGQIAGPALAGFLAASVAGWGFDKIFGEKKKSDNWKDNWGKKLGRLATTTGTGAAAGAGVGFMAGGISAVPGAVIGGVAGLGKGLYDEFVSEPTQDGIIPAGYQPKQFDKGTAIIKNGTINPINNKDDLLTMKPDGPVARKLGTADNQPNIVKHEFGDLRINGELKVTSPGNSNAHVDLLKSPEFVRSITHMIQVEMQRGKNQVQKP